MLDVIDMDNHIIVCYKPSGVLSQADGSNDPDMLNMVKSYIKEKFNKPGDVYTGLVHRLDRNTSGLMVFAKTSKAASRLCADIKEHNFSKCYLAVCEGHFDKLEGTLKNNLLKNEKENKSYVRPNGKEAILDYKVLDEKNINGHVYSLVNINLHTGRHHQIRCQLSYIGHPLYGDVKYGAKSKVGNYYALGAYKLSFNHPTLHELREYKYFKSENIFLNFSNDILNTYNL